MQINGLYVLESIKHKVSVSNCLKATGDSRAQCLNCNINSLLCCYLDCSEVVMRMKNERKCYLTGTVVGLFSRT